ncbi:MAG: hypothetical protein U5M23_07985 [Marinagarivorans sp.]|nr:hypothetical protein [Marinagarivorans sp.]
METLAAYIPQLMITAGLALLVFEVVVLGFATFILFFLGVSLVLTGIVAWVGILPTHWSALLLSNALLTAILAAFLWKFMLKMQNQTDIKPVKTDFDGYRFYLSDDVNRLGGARYSYSGVDWALCSEQPIAAGAEVEIVKAEVGVLWVKAVL